MTMTRTEKTEHQSMIAGLGSRGIVAVTFQSPTEIAKRGGRREMTRAEYIAHRMGRRRSTNYVYVMWIEGRMAHRTSRTRVF
jgi:hypothetical protein